MEVPDIRLRGVQRQLLEPDPDHAGVGNERFNQHRPFPLCMVQKPWQEPMAPMVENNTRLLEDALKAIAALRAGGARVHCITNAVAQNFTANVLLACGATPSMTIATDEVAFFTNRSGALLVNLGTLDDARRQAIDKSVDICNESGKPFVLDPVLCDVSAPRLQCARQLAERGPAIIRANEVEMAALEMPAKTDRSVLAITGETDHVYDGKVRISVTNGHPWLSKVTAIGCAQGALMAALLASGARSQTAALAAIVWMTIAGERAAASAGGPGTFQMHLLDQLHGISLTQLELGANLI